MDNPPDLLEILSRTRTGEFCTQKEWDTRRIPSAVRAKLREYGLTGSFDPDEPVNIQFDLADTFFQAAHALALELGYLCTDTERIVSVSQEELDNALKFAPTELHLGEGTNGTTIRSRTPGDPYPIKVCASLAIAMSEPMYPIITELIAREPEVDILGGGSMITLRGREVYSGTPFETLLGYEQARLHREIRRRAGRPGMAGNGVFSAVTEYGQFGGYGVPGGFPTTDLALVLFPAELKIDYRSLHKVIYTRIHQGPLRCDSPGMVGGMSGPPEGAALTSIACALLSYAILGTDLGGGQIYDVRYLANVNREGLWALSITQEAISRNTHTMPHPIANSVSGPGTAALLYEIAAGVSVAASCGGSMTTGPRSAGGKLTDHITPLECRFVAEVAHAASCLSPVEASRIVKALLPQYEATLKAPDLGQTFQQLYDLETLQPSETWERTYRDVKSRVKGLGLPLDEF